MTETYKLAATPVLFPAGEFEGELKGVAFTATSRDNTRQWFTINCGQFGKSFSRVVPSRLAEEMIKSLVRVNDIEFPGIYRNRQFDGGFAYVHNGNAVILTSCDCN